MSTSDRHASPLDRRSEPVGELVKDLSKDITELVRQEVSLARVEMTEKGKQAGLGVGMLSGAAAFALVTLGGTMATITILLDRALSLWLAALITTITYGAVAAILALQGRDKLKETGAPIPERTKESVKEDIQWAKTSAQSKPK